MSEGCSKISIPGDNVRRERSQDKTGAVSGTVHSMNKWIRAAVASLGLLGAAEQSGCAHAPKVVPHSEMQEQRQVCVVETPTDGVDSKTRSRVLKKIQEYVRQRYTPVDVRQIGSIDSLNGLKGQREKFIKFRCDDVLVVDTNTNIVRKTYDKRSVNWDEVDIIKFHAAMTSINVETNSETHVEGAISYQEKREQECGFGWSGGGSRGSGGKYAWHCGESQNVSTKELLEGLSGQLDDLVEDSLLDDYRPDKLPPLSLANVEEETAESVIAHFSQSREAQRSPGKSPLDFSYVHSQAKEYLERFPNGAHADRIRGIIASIRGEQQRVAEQQQRVAEQEKLRQELRAGRNSHVQELRREFAIAREAENNGEYEKAAIHFGKAKQAIYLVGAAYREADITPPHDLDLLAFETKRGLAENEGRIGVRNPYVTGQDTSNYPGKGVEEGAKMLAAEAVAAALIAGRAVPYIAEKVGGQPGTPTEGTAPGNGEIEVITGATGGLSAPIPCTDDGFARRLPNKSEPEKKCTTFGGPSCTIFDLSPGKYDVSALRSGGCTIKKAGPVEVTVEPNKHMRVDFSGNLK